MQYMSKLQLNKDYNSSKSRNIIIQVFFFAEKEDGGSELERKVKLSRSTPYLMFN